MALEKTWRWFGQKDSVLLSDLKQMGIEGVVTALHHIPNGEVWPVDEILKVKTEIETYGMRWSVVESLPVSEGIKIHSSDYDRLIANYQQSLRNLGRCGIDTVCYNFMPVLDWARTDLHYQLPNGGESMYFDYPTFAAFDIFILKRANAEADYPDWMVEKAETVFRKMSEGEAEKLAHNIIVVTQGFINGTVGDVEDYKKVFLKYLQNYSEIDKDGLRKNLASFLNDVVPVAEETGINLCIHPDDPPYPILGLPRIAGTIEDYKWIMEQNKSLRNGITFCSGSLSARADNNLVDFVHQLGDRIHFIHLRNTQMLEDGSFYESGHLKGNVDMYELLRALLEEQNRRKSEGRSDYRMPMRPDHGIKILDDYQRKSNPGYPLTGRLKGLAELTGLETGIERTLKYL